MTELTFPRVMMVSDEPITSKNPGKQRVVWAYNPKFYYSFFTYYSDIQTLKDVENISEEEQGWGGLGGCWGGDCFKYAQEPQQQIELTLDEIADKFGISVNNLKIKK
jgi:hypothetical protein